MASDERQDVHDYAPRREVRFAVVMYGGVSLAVYINGVAQELFRLVQATAPAAPGSAPGALRFADADLRPSARIYRELARRLDDDDGRAGAVTTRFVVDILSGTSAGGINGVLLAKALVNGSDFTDPSRRIWLSVASIVRLLWWAPSLRLLSRRSLLNGDYLYREALGTLAALGREEPEPYVEQLDLAVTATDRAGLQASVQLAQEPVTERQHRTVFDFSHWTEATNGEARDDFGADCDRMLAFAARATSAFPFAFEPVSLGALPRRPFATPQRDGVEWLPEHARQLPQRRVDDVLFSDGGFLDNKPFTHATRALRRRRADLPVTRLLLYVEPDPAAPAVRAPRPPSRGPLAAVRAASSLPRVETIRQDVVEVTERSARIALLRRIEARALEELPERMPPKPPPDDPSYQQLRLEMTAEWLASAAAEAHDLDAGAERDAAQAFAELIGADLDLFDIPRARRRLSFLNDRLNGGSDGELLRKRAINDAFVPLRRARPRLVATRGSREAFSAVAWLTAARAELEGVADELRELERGLDEADRTWLVDQRARFELIDRTVLPLAYPDLGELNAVDVHRVSPLDARALSRVGNAKLGGIRLGHFGAFLSRRYRWNDLLWGRLDAVEVIARALISDDVERESFRIRAQAAIVREALHGPGRRATDGLGLRLRMGRGAGLLERDDMLLDRFRSTVRPPRALSPARWAIVVAAALVPVVRLLLRELVALLVWLLTAPSRWAFDALRRRF